MNTISLIHDPGFVGQFTPMKTLATERCTLYDGWSTKGGATRPVYRNAMGDLFVTTLNWPDVEVQLFAELWAREVTTVELSDEEADAVIAQLNSNLLGGPPP